MFYGYKRKDRLYTTVIVAASTAVLTVIVIFLVIPFESPVYRKLDYSCIKTDIFNQTLDIVKKYEQIMKNAIAQIPAVESRQDVTSKIPTYTEIDMRELETTVEHLETEMKKLRRQCKCLD